jgi:hypothetical protein
VTLADLVEHTRRLGLKRFFRGMGYERCAELPLVVQQLRSSFPVKLDYLDIGSGDSILPTYILKNSVWDVTCVDKYKSVQRQLTYAKRVGHKGDYEKRLHIIEKDFLEEELPRASFDVITNISVIEHFDESTDVAAMRKSASLLKIGGKYILTTLINEGHFKEFYLDKSVYGNHYRSKPVFFQRHYDISAFNDRIVRSSGLKELQRIYFGEYGYQFFHNFLDIQWPWKLLKVLYQWASPAFAERFMSYRDYPVSRPDKNMYTSSGVFIILTKSR